MGMKPRVAGPAEARLADAIRSVLGPRDDVEELRMFGGLCFKVRGYMCVGVTKTDLMVRVGPEAYQDALAEPDARVMDFTRRPLRGFVYATPKDRARLVSWIQRALDYVESQPSK